MKNLIIVYIIILNIFTTIEDNSNSNNNSKPNTTKNKDKDKEKNKSENIKSFIIHISFIVGFIILVYISIKICIRCCKKRFAYKKLLGNFVNNQLLGEEVIEQVKYVYGFDYVMSFLTDIIFISCKYKQKIEEIKNCGNCSICLNGFDLNDKIFITACNHVYHNKCITDYLNLIVKDLDISEREIENFHDNFQCPNCKEFLFSNRKFLEKYNHANIEEITEKGNNNNNNMKNVEVVIVSHKSKKIPFNNLISTEGSSKRNLKTRKSKIMQNNNTSTQGSQNSHKHAKDIPKTSDIKIENIEGENNNYQSDMKLKNNIENNNIEVNNKMKVIQNNMISESSKSTKIQSSK